MHLESAHGDLPNERFFPKDDKRLLKYELYIQVSTNVDILGFHEDAPIPEQIDPVVDFQSNCSARGFVRAL